MQKQRQQLQRERKIEKRIRAAGERNANKQRLAELVPKSVRVMQLELLSTMQQATEEEKLEMTMRLAHRPKIKFEDLLLENFDRWLTD